ncbi:hypothetical protein [Psychrobacillus sp. FJAT-21963]|uniref:hypothetical protein n=1 Tax=Psychrobacillus sp. FJAT-21963 TaxID=1712028 RepID=UPI0006F7932C|nr:hypothetical protein [Psychrobacillus sp. FJAT-21963]KQL35812.1 hypothetical protein AN959_07925 [Psychrobacillus sp. FJAT-21963]
MGTIQSGLIEKGLKHVLIQEIEKENTRSKREKERFSCRELEDLMGCNRDTYKRVRGAVKRR